MLARLAVRNVRRSARDYAVYFVTLLFGVAVFYAFNSIDSQAVLFDIEKNAVGSILEMTSYFIGMFSVAVAVVLAFLVTYANRFIIKRRKREFGTYLLLGMSASRVACVLSIEMLVVGAVSLLVGLVVGLVLSQALAFATAALMGTTMTHYTFVVSTSALVKTLICFAVLFAAALVMNVVFVSRRKVGVLLAEHGEAKVTSRIPLWARIVGFVLALAVLVVAYWLLWDNQFKEFDSEFTAATLLMVIGTFLLFWSGSTIVLSLVKRAHGFYFRGLHAFTARQLSSKVGTAFASLSVVCIMLFFALTTVSVGFGMRALFVDSIEQTTRYDVTFTDVFCAPGLYGDAAMSGQDSYENRLAYMQENYPERLEAARASGLDMARDIAAHNSAWNELVKDSVQLDYYSEPQMEWGSVLSAAGIEISSLENSGTFATSSPLIVSESQFNAACRLAGEKTYQLADDEYLVNNTFKATEDTAGQIRARAMPLAVAGTSLHASGEKASVEMRTSAVADVMLEIVVPDRVVERMKAQGALPTYCYLNCMYSCDRVEGDARLVKILQDGYPSNEIIASNEVPLSSTGWPYSYLVTAQAMIDQAGGLRLLITYLALYIGFVLLVSTAAILAIQQLSETADSVGRYQRLSSLGCDRSMILGSLRTQTVLYFLVPLGIALVHAVYALCVMNSGFFAPLGVDPMPGILITGAFVLVIYGCYLLVAYLASRRVVCDACGF
jgi:putative ABC transport system permease protein